MDALNKILIIYANSGAGHRRAAEALNCVIKDYFPESSIRLLDVLDYTTPVFKKTYPMIYLLMVNYFPRLWGLLYYFLDNIWIDNIARVFRRATNSVHGQEFMSFLKEEKPDLVITTHFLPNEFISYLKKKYHFSTHLVTCITDYYPHAWWKDSGVDLYITPNLEMEPRLIQLGIPTEKIVHLGIPIHPVFCEHTEKMRIRQKLGLKKDQFTVLITSGGFGVGPVKELVINITRISIPLQIIVICGRNSKLQDDLTELTKKSLHKLHIFGFVQNIHEFMVASELMISKSGGLTSTEAMALGLPFITFKPIPGQESGNCDFLVRHHAGLRIKNARQAHRVIEKLLGDSEQLRILKQNMLKLGRPKAAGEIVAYLKDRFDPPFS